MSEPEYTKFVENGVKSKNQMYKMLVEIKGIVESEIAELNQLVTLEEIELFGDSKIAATVSTPHLMGSIEIFQGLTIDMLIIEFDSEDVIYSESFNSINSPGEFTELLNAFLIKLNVIEK